MTFVLKISVYHKYLWPVDWAVLKKDFQRLFRMPFGDFYDSLVSWVSGKYCIDVVRFDDALHSRFGEYERRGLSMRDLVLQEYGRAALDCLEGLL